MKKPRSERPGSALKEPFSIRGWLKQNWIALVVLAVAAVVFGVLFHVSHQGQIYQKQSETYQRISYEKAQVVNISKDNVSPDRYKFEENELGQQTMLARILSGPYAGEVVETVNNVTLFYGVKMAVGEEFVISIYEEDGQIVRTSFYEYNRVPAIFILLAVFVLITVLVGGKTGLKSLLGLALTVAVLIWIYCPLLIKGASPAWLALGLCVYVEIICFTLLDGVRRKTVCAMLGTAAGMGIAVLFGVIAQAVTRITSYNMYSTNSLVDEFNNIQVSGIPLHIHGLLSAGIVIASLGAVMDVAMSLSSAIQELKTVNPDLTLGQLWRSAMRIGRDMVGTMTNTLILAFAGSSLLLIIYLWSLDLSFYQLLSSSFLAVELIQALASSIGVILCVPLTALIGALFFGGKKPVKAR